MGTSIEKGEDEEEVTLSKIHIHPISNQSSTKGTTFYYS